MMCSSRDPPFPLPSALFARLQGALRELVLLAHQLPSPGRHRLLPQAGSAADGCRGHREEAREEVVTFGDLWC